MKKIIFFLFSLASLFSLQASHFMGVTMWYECLGGCNYRIYHTIYFDCAGAATSGYVQPMSNANPYPAPGGVSAIGSTGCIAPAMSGAWSFVSWEEVTPICSTQTTQCSVAGATIGGVAAATYYCDYIPCTTGCSSVTLNWSNCCRNYSITSGAMGNGLYTQMTIDFVNAPCNSSPHFVNPAIAYISAGQSISLPQTALDPNGDSLVYSLDSCWQNATLPINYNPGYSPLSPLGPGWGVSINAITGELSFLPIPAGGNGPVVGGVLGVKVSEYRNGQLIGSIRRDMEVRVLATPLNSPPTYTISNLIGAVLTNNNVLHVNTNVTCSFDITVIDSSTQLLNFMPYITTQFPTGTVTGTPNTNPLLLHVSFTPSPGQTGGNYPLYIDIFDDNCPIVGYNYVLYHIVDTFAINTTITDAICGVIGGSIDITPIANLAPVSPISYLWNNGDTTQDISNVPSGAYWLQIMGNNNFVWNSDTFYVNANNLLTSFASVSPDCNIPNGSIAATTNGGLSPYSYTWNTGQAGNTLNSLGVGGYSVNITDALGCFAHEVLSLNFDPADSCFSKIGGRLYYDTNNNCVQDTWEVGVPNAYIDINPGGAMLTDSLGNYLFIVNSTGIYTITYIQMPWMLATSVCIPSFSQNVHINLLGVDSLQKHFPIQLNPDLSVSLNENGYVPGGQHNTVIWCHNTSYYLSNATVTYQHSPIFKNLIFNPPATTYNAVTRTATWQLNNFTAGTSRYIHVQGNTDSTAVIGDTAESYINIIPVIGDINPQNNQDTSTRVVGASYDPNYKEVFPQGETNYGLIPQATPKLEYVLNFQNTGNYPAQDIILRDTIDSDLDITSIDMQISSHPCTITIENDEILVFTFNNINLPDSTTDEPNSHGFVKFGINLKPNLPLDTQIDNSVAIYFDYNAPVITNSVKNTLYNPMQLVMADSFTLCPTDLLTLTVQDGKAPYTFSWDNGTVVSGNTTGVSTIPANFLNGTHTVQVSDFYGAIRHRTFSFSAVLPLADASFSSSSTGNTVAFSANVQGLASYAWDFGNGQTSTQASANITYTNAGTYTVGLIVTDNCGRQDTMTTEINVTVNIADVEFTQHIRLFPNPFSQFTTLSFDNPDNSPYELSIFDLSGKLVQKISNIRSNEVKISMENKAKGRYLWELKGKSKARGMLWVE